MMNIGRTTFVMFPNFKREIIDTGEVKINLVRGGSGLPILLLHGYPQTHVIWHKIAAKLAEKFTVIATDLRGYGDSDKPPANSDHSNYSKRTMARDQITVMSQLGYQQFYLVGHDRGARVAHRLALDYPERVKKMVLLDIAPTYDMYAAADQEFATAYYHWFFLIQPYPFPETLISANPDYFLRHCLQSWSADLTAFPAEACAEYLRCFRKPETIHATCEDYRASATIDLEDDAADREHKIECPLLVMWGKKGLIERKYDVLATWRKRAINVSGISLDCGHFLPEEAPQATYHNILDFLKN